MSAETIQPPRILDEWLSEEDTKERLQRCADEVVKVFNHDWSNRVPREPQYRRNQFEKWRAECRMKLADTMHDAFNREFPEMSPHLPQSLILLVFAENIWPLVEEKLIDFAVEGITIPWVRSNLGTAIVVGRLERSGERMTVSLTLPRDSKRIGMVSLDLDGNIIESESSTRTELLAALNG